MERLGGDEPIVCVCERGPSLFDAQLIHWNRKV